MTPRIYLTAMKTYFQLQRNLKTDLDQLKARQWQRFIDLVTFAYEHVPFYRVLYDRAGFSPSELKTPADITSVPTTRKSMFQDPDMRLFLADGYSPDRLIHRTTSGSSGSPLNVYYTPDDRIYRTLVHLRALHHNGVRLRDRVAQITYREDPGFRYIFQKAGFLSREFISIKANPLENQIDQISAFNPDVIYGYPSSLAFLAGELRERGNHQIDPKHIFTTGELLNLGDRKLINRAFKVSLKDIYGIVEMGDVAWQCPELGGYHLNVDNFLAEVTTDGRQAKPGEVGHLTITNLHSRAMPFIRYEVGDMLAAYRENPCPCGCTFPLVDVIQGREDDWLCLPDGKRFSPMAFEVSAIPGIKQYRVIQKDYDQLFVEVIPGFDFMNRTRENVREHLQKIVGPSMRVRVSKVDHIPQQSGKMRRFISEIEHPLP